MLSQTFKIFNHLILASEPEEVDLAVGGQAVMEGVMMRGKNKLVVAVRDPRGVIQVKKDPFRALTQRYKFLNIPILRGMINMVEMLYVGVKALNWSAEIALDEKEEEKNKLTGFLLGALSLIFGLGLAFIVSLFRPIFTDRKQIAAATGITVLGSVDMIWTRKAKLKRRIYNLAYGASLVALLLSFALVMLVYKLDINVLSRISSFT